MKIKGKIDGEDAKLLDILTQRLEYTTQVMTGNCTERIGGHGDVCSGCKSVALKNYTLIERAKLSIKEPT